MSVVLDASAVLAFVQNEAGVQRVRSILGEAIISTVNWSEVIGKAQDREVDTHGLREDLGSLGLQFEPFSVEQAELAGRIKEQTRPLGLSLGDRACLALGLDRNAPVLTSDRAWLALDLDIEVQLIR